MLDGISQLPQNCSENIVGILALKESLGTVQLHCSDRSHSGYSKLNLTFNFFRIGRFSVCIRGRTFFSNGKFSDRL